MGNSCLKNSKVKSKAIEPKIIINQARLSPQPENHFLNRLTEAQISLLEEKFKKFQKTEEGLDLEGFKKMMPYISHLPDNVIFNAFQEFANQKSSQIVWLDFCKAVSKYVLGSNEEKCKFLYTIFENKKHQSLKKNEANQLNKYISTASQNFPSNFNSFDKSGTGLLSLFSTHDSILYNDFKTWAFDNLDLHKALQPFEVIPSAATEKEYFRMEMSNFIKTGLEAGEFYYLISSKWLETWKNFVSYDIDNHAERSPRISYRYSARPIAINNSSLLDPKFSEKVLSSCKENDDFVVLPKKVWKDLLKWYDGGPEIKRKAIKISEKVELEVFLVHFVVNQKSEKRNNFDIFVSITDSVKDILSFASENMMHKNNLKFFLQVSEKFQFFESFISISSLPLKEINICKIKSYKKSQSKDLSILFTNEIHDFDVDEPIEYLSNGYWMPGIIKSVTYNHFIIKTNWHKHLITIPQEELSLLRRPSMTLIRDKKLSSSTGLINIGNTCFLNSILQSLFHTPLFADFFSSSLLLKSLKPYKYTELLKIFLELCVYYKSTHKLKIHPTKFYKELLKHTVQFQEGQQNDCHELLIVLLEIIHEGLVKEKIHLQTTLRVQSREEQEEKLLSKRQWVEYREKNGSIISAIFGGQTRNVFTCQNCGQKKINFEVFNVFSVPIPTKNLKNFGFLTFIPKASANVTKFPIKLSENADIEEFIEFVQKITYVKLSNLIFGYNRQGLCTQLFQPLSFSELFKSNKKELCAFEIFTFTSEIEKSCRFFIAENKTKNWRTEIKENQLVEIYHENTWHLAHVVKALPDNLQVKLHVDPPVEETFNRMDENIQYFTTNILFPMRVIQIPVNHIKVGKKISKAFGIPQVLSIGNWLTWYEFHAELSMLISNYSKNMNPGKSVHFFLYNLKKEGCGICKNSCQGCEIKKNFSIILNLTEIYQDLVIRVFWQNVENYKLALQKTENFNETFEIHECFEKFLEKESVDFICEGCGKRDQISQTEVWRLPDILTIHLKRFCFEKQVMKKIDSLIKFPIKDLNMSSLMLNSKKKAGLSVKNSDINYLYDLYAVVNHNGTISSGHYTTYCLNEDDKWLFFDDERSFLLNKDIEEEIISHKAYILFYKRKRFRPSNILNTRDILKSL